MTVPPGRARLLTRLSPSLLWLLALAACATPGGPAVTAADPLEPFNRKVFSANQAVDDAVIRPVAVGYRAVVPRYGRERIHRFLGNLQEPRIFVNALLQLRLPEAGQTVMRFVFNSTLGLAGFYDVATDWGLGRSEGDFGQTLHRWGMASGSYLMLPLAGPSNPRDTVGLVGDIVLDPFNWLLPIEVSLGRGVVSGIDLREQNIEGLDELSRGSLDFYARLRSVWQQRRAAELGLEGGAAEPVSVLDDPQATP